MTYSLLRDVQYPLNPKADAVQFYWNEARYWAFETMLAARRVWAFRTQASIDSSKFGKDLDVELKDNYSYSVLVSDERFYERLTNMFCNLASAGKQMEDRDGRKYTLAGQSRRAQGPTG
jgi:hypothetical protein